MVHGNKKLKVRERLLMIYVRRNIRLTLFLSIGSLILVLVASSSGGFAYFSSKKSMSLAAKESPVDVVYRQEEYINQKTLLYPYEYLRIIYNDSDIADCSGISAVLIDLNVTINGNDRGIHSVLILSVSKKEGLNITLSQGYFINRTDEIIISEDFFEQFNATIGGYVGLIKWISKIPPNMQWVSGRATGVTPKHFSQLTRELGLHNPLILAGYTEADLLFFDNYPFVLLNMNSSILQPYFLDYAQSHPSLPSILATFFVKFNEEAYLNQWDTDITVFNLKELAQEKRQDMNNFTSTRTGSQYDIISIRSIPAADMFQELSQFININKLTIIAFGATVAFVGWYFYSSLTQTALSARTRELQLLKVRGASQKSITRSMSLIVISSGIVGTAIGLILGFLLTTNTSPTIFNTPVTQTDITQTFGILSILFYALFGLAASTISQRQVLSRARLGITATEEKGLEAQIKMGLAEKLVIVIALCLGSIKVASWLLRIDLISTGQTANPITSALVLFARLINQTILDALGALLLIYAMVTIVSRTPKILSTLSQWVSKALSPRLSLLSKKIMNTKSVKMGGIMIVSSLLIFNAVSANLGHRGVEVAWRNLSTTIVGADVRIDIPEEVSLSVIQQFGNVSGIADYAQVLIVSSSLGPPLGRCVVYAIDPQEYAAILKINEGDFESLTEDAIFVSDFFYEIGLLSVGDSVTLAKETLVVRKFVSNMLGLLSIPPIERFAVVNVSSLNESEYSIISRTLLLRVNGASPDIVVEDLMNYLPEDIRLKVSMTTESQTAAIFGKRMAAPLIFENVMSVLSIASVVGVIFAALALGVMGYNGAVERRGLDGLLRIKGVTRRQLIGMALSEGLCILALSLIIGFFTGYAMASGYTFYFSAAFPVNAVPTPSYELVVQVLMLIAIYITAFLTPVLYALKKPVRFHIY
jgi:ABC-type antimicrobial peptide transport system permease subunit